MKKSIAFFDFDGTITSKDTMLELIKFHFGYFQFIKGMLYVLPWIAGMKTKMVSHQLAKEKLLSYFFKGMLEYDFIQICNDFTSQRLPGLIRKSAMQKIEQYRKDKVPVVVVTASAESWVKKWC
ncbi:MAG: HAD family hydrolase, partial [Ferruginibacter sp.]